MFERMVEIIVRCVVIFILATLAGVVYSKSDSIWGKLGRIINVSINIVCGFGITNLLIYIFTGFGVDPFLVIGEAADNALSKINAGLVQLYVALAIILLGIYVLRLAMIILAFVFTKLRTNTCREIINLVTNLLFMWVAFIMIILAAHVYIAAVLQLTSIML